jgi:hypothetical protein
LACHVGPSSVSSAVCARQATMSKIALAAGCHGSPLGSAPNGGQGRHCRLRGRTGIMWSRYRQRPHQLHRFDLPSLATYWTLAQMLVTLSSTTTRRGYFALRRPKPAASIARHIGDASTRPSSHTRCRAASGLGRRRFGSGTSAIPYLRGIFPAAWRRRLFFRLLGTPIFTLNNDRSLDPGRSLSSSGKLATRPRMQTGWDG